MAGASEMAGVLAVAGDTEDLEMVGVDTEASGVMEVLGAMVAGDMDILIIGDIIIGALTIGDGGMALPICGDIIMGFGMDTFIPVIAYGIHNKINLLKYMDLEVL
jgi:hypothetical protein